ncbi:MAG: hypothetical protein NUV84_00525 [Candidatus Uhrbacteria bacterium]|nr:hypothetical protein [Candidatus Uhrbacteria bacterium]
MKKAFIAISIVLFLLSGCGFQSSKPINEQAKDDHFPSVRSFDGNFEMPQTNEYFLYITKTDSIDHDEVYLVVDNVEGNFLFRKKLSDSLAEKLSTKIDGTSPFFESYKDSESNLYFLPYDNHQLDDGRSIYLFANVILLAIDFEKEEILLEHWVDGNFLNSLDGVTYSLYTYLSGRYEAGYWYVGIVDSTHIPFVVEDLSGIEGSWSNSITTSFDGLSRIEWLEDGSLVLRFIKSEEIQIFPSSCDPIFTVDAVDFVGDEATIFSECIEILKVQYPDYQDINCHSGMNAGCYGLTDVTVYSYTDEGLQKVRSDF